jgi:hypothetical protein
MTMVPELCFYEPKTHTVIDCLIDGRGMYSGETLEQVRLRYGPGVVVMNTDEAWTDHENAFRSAPVEITEEQFWDALEVLPPCRWRRSPGAESFHMSEHTTGCISSIYVRIGDYYYTFADDVALTHEERVAKCMPLHRSNQRVNRDAEGMEN